MKYERPEMEIMILDCEPVTQVSVVPGATVDVPSVDASDPF